MAGPAPPPASPPVCCGSWSSGPAPRCSVGFSGQLYTRCERRPAWAGTRLCPGGGSSAEPGQRVPRGPARLRSQARAASPPRTTGRGQPGLDTMDHPPAHRRRWHALRALPSAAWRAGMVPASPAHPHPRAAGGGCKREERAAFGFTVLPPGTLRGKAPWGFPGREGVLRGGWGHRGMCVGAADARHAGRTSCEAPPGAGRARAFLSSHWSRHTGGHCATRVRTGI